MWCHHRHRFPLLVDRRGGDPLLPHLRMLVEGGAVEDAVVLDMTAETEIEEIIIIMVVVVVAAESGANDPGRHRPKTWLLRRGLQHG